MSDVSPDELTPIVQKVGRNASLLLVALQSATGTPVVALAQTLDDLAEGCEKLLAAPSGALLRYDPETDAAAVRALSEVPTYVPNSLAELESDFTLDDRQALSALLSKYLFSDIYPGNPVDRTEALSGAMNTVIDHLEGLTP